jgi:hypothetical protein
MSVYFISTDQQYPGGIMGYDTDGNAVRVGGRFDHLYEIETSDSSSVIAKAIDAGCHVRSCPATVTVSFEVGCESGINFTKSLGEQIPARSRVKLRLVGRQVEYSFARDYALGGRR